MGLDDNVGFADDFERERARYEDGMARLDPEQLVRLGNAAYGAGLALLMLGRREESADWLERAALRWRESWEHATPTSWGRPIGVLKATLLAGGDASGEAEWALGLGPAEAESPIGLYAAALALLVLGRWDEVPSLQGREDFPPAVGDAIAAVAAGDGAAADEALGRVLESFEGREDYLEDVPVADTALVLQALANRRGLEGRLRPSALLPG